MGSVPDSNNHRGSIPVLWMLWITTFGRPKTIKNPQKKTGRFTRPNHIMGLQPLIPKSGDRRFPWQEPTKTPVPSAYNLVVQAWRRQWPRQPIAKSSICLVHFVVELLGPQVLPKKKLASQGQQYVVENLYSYPSLSFLNPLLNAHLASCEEANLHQLAGPRNSNAWSAEEGFRATTSGGSFFEVATFAAMWRGWTTVRGLS